jgi:hypothetical protein
MKKQEVQQRVLQDGKPLDLDKFNWNEGMKTFSSNEYGLVLDFKGIVGCTFNTGEECVVARRDMYEVIELDGTKKIKLNGYESRGYTVVEDETENEKKSELLKKADELIKKANELRAEAERF